MADELARDEEDHDLLTFNESAIRLRDEITATEAALRENPAEEQRAALEGRLAALAGALERNTRQVRSAARNSSTSAAVMAMARPRRCARSVMTVLPRPRRTRRNR